jgi:hypothetical protein
MLRSAARLRRKSKSEEDLSQRHGGTKGRGKELLYERLSVHLVQRKSVEQQLCAFAPLREDILRFPAPLREDILRGNEGMKLLNAIEIKSHTDCLAVFVLEFVVKKKTIFSIKGENVFIMFYISVNSKKTNSKIIIAALAGYAMGSLYHKGTYAAVYLPERLGNSKFSYFHSRNSPERVIQIMEFFFRNRKLNGIRNERHNSSYLINLSTNSSIFLLRSIASGDMGLRICLIIFRAILLSLISVDCTGFILTAISASISNISHFWFRNRLLVSRIREKDYLSPPRRYFGGHINSQPVVGGNFYSLRNTHGENIA